MSTYYYYNEAGHYVGSAASHNESAPPDGCLLVAPELTEGRWPVLNEARDGWVMVEDHRGEHIWAVENKQEMVICDLGPIPEGVTLSRPNAATDIYNAETDSWDVAPQSEPEPEPEPEPPVLSPKEKREQAYRMESDVFYYTAEQYKREAEGWRLLGDEENAVAADTLHVEYIRKYLEKKEEIRARIPDDGGPGIEDASLTDTPEPESCAEPAADATPAVGEVYLTNAGTYHLPGCSSTSAAGEWLSLAAVAAAHPEARRCGRCQPPELEAGNDGRE